ncbi:MAG: TlpA family protein disulfide reductase [Pyrinomonadaceae bacterium]|nr:TlpA family protein disulfide reductase [Pyrinomonadaceae bacterium]
MNAIFRWKTKLLLMFALTALAVASGCATQSKISDITTTTGKAVVTANNANEQTPTRGTALGNIAPDFQLARTDGSTVKFDDLRGQPAVLVFWTAWCPSCKEEAPHVNELAAKFEPRGVRVLGINIQDSPARLAGGVKEFGIKYGVASDSDAAVARRYKVVGTPTIVFLDEQGIVRYFGNELPEDYAAQLDALLAKA